MRLRALPVLLAFPALLAQGQGVQEFKLPTGLRCLLVENHDHPLLRMDLTVRWDPEDAAVQKGQVGFLGRLLESSGAGTANRAEMNRAKADLGMLLSFEGRRDAFHWSAAVDSSAQEPAMEWLANAVFRPNLDSPGVEAERQRQLMRVTGATLRESAISRHLWKLRDPRATLEPGGAGLDHLELQELLTLHRRLIRPEHAVLLLYGDLNLAQAKQLAYLHMGVWGPRAVPAPAPLPRPALERSFLALLENTPQAELWASAVPPGPLGAEEEGLLAILLDRRARACSGALEIRCSLQSGRPLTLTATATGLARETLVSGLMEVLDALRVQGFTQEELNRARVQWRGGQTALPLHPEALIQGILRSRLDPAGNGEAVTLAGLNKVLAEWLKPEGLQFLLLGGDAPMLQAAEKAGLGKAVMVKAQ